MSAMIPFSFEGKQVRVFNRDGSPWWVAADVCDVLEIVKTDRAISRLDADETDAHSMSIRSENGVEQRREMTIINESGLWSLVLTSRKPEAKRFKKWITSEVIPSIRKTGGYHMGGRRHVDSTLPLRRAQLVFSAALRFNSKMGMDINQARLKALAATKDQTGLDLAREFGWQPQPAPVQERTLNATDIGKTFNTDGRGGNAMLESMGFQTGSRDHKGRLVWTPTEKGKPYARLEDQTKAHSEGTVQQWRWYPAIIEALKNKEIAA